MTHVMDWKRSDDPRDVVHLAVQALAEGHLVAIPTDTLYNFAGSVMQPEAMHKLVQFRKRNPAARLTLSLRSVDEVEDYCPTVSKVAMRIAHRAWPGPLGLVIDGCHADSLIQRFPEESRNCLLDDQGRITLRVPAHEAFRHIHHLSAGPIALVAAPPQGDQQPVTAATATADEVALAVDDGVTHYQGPSTCVSVEGNVCRVVSPGVLDLPSLKNLSQMVVLVVCTGNTCRSPMAEKLMQAKLQKRFGLQTKETPSPITVLSAGISAMSGGRASAEAAKTMHEVGLDLTHHRSSPLTERLANHADLILAMTSGHRQSILSRWPQLAQKTFLVSQDGYDVSDPFGSEVEVYRACAEQIDGFLEPWVERIQSSDIPEWR